MLDKLKNSKKGLVNIKNDDNRCSLWCHTRHLNPLKTHSERIPKMDRETMVDSLNYSDINFAVSKKDYSKIEKKNSICINVFGYENSLMYPVHAADEVFEDCMNLFLKTDVKKLFDVYIKNCNRFFAITENTEIENTFKDIGCSALVVKKILVEQINFLFKINGKQIRTIGDYYYLYLKTEVLLLLMYT